MFRLVIGDPTLQDKRLEILAEPQWIAAAHIDAVIRVYDKAGNITETHEHKGEFKER